MTLSLEDAIGQMSGTNATPEAVQVVAVWLGHKGFHEGLADKFGMLTRWNSLDSYMSGHHARIVTQYLKKGLCVEDVGPLLCRLCVKLNHDPVVFLSTPI